jgi:PAS domain S-box-containing protein
MVKMGSWIFDTDAGKIIWSDNIYELLGYKPNMVDLSLSHFQKLIHPEDRKRFKDEMNLVLQEGIESEFEFRLIKTGQERHLKGVFSLMQNETKKFLIATIQDVTKQNNLQQQLQERLQIAELLGENIIDAVIVTDIHNNIIFWNRQCEEVYNKKKEQVINKNYFDVFPHQKNEETVAHFNAVLRGEAVHETKVRSTLFNGYYNLHMIPLKNVDQAVIGILHLMHDVTKEFQLNKDLGERLAFIEELVEASVDAIIVMDRNMNYLYWNKRAEQLYGLKKEQVLGKNVLELFPAFIDNSSYSAFRKALNGETSYISGNENTEEENIFFDTYLIPVKNEKGYVTGILWMVHNLDEEKKLQRQKIKETIILDALNESFFELDSDYRISYMNQNCLEFFGKTKEEVIGKLMWDAIPQCVDTWVQEAIHKAMKEGSTTRGEFISPSKGTWVQCSIAPTADGIIGLLLDIQEKKEREEKLEKEYYRLKEAQEIGKIGSFEWDAVTDTIEWSDEMYRIHGLQPQSEVITIEKVFEFVHAEDRELVEKKALQIRKTGGNDVIAHRIIRTDGEIRHVLRRFQTFTDEAGRVILHGTVQDITELKTITEKLHDSQRFIERIATSTPNVLYLMDINTKKVTYTNRPIAEVLEYDDEQIAAMNEPLLELMHPEDLPKMLDHVNNMKNANDKEVREIVYRLKHASGNYHWFKDNNSVFERDVKGVPTIKIGITQEITKQLLQEEEIKTHLNILQQSEQLANLGSWEFEIESETFRWSEGMYQLFGLEQNSEVTPEIYNQFSTGAYKNTAKNLAKGIRKGNKPLEETLQIRVDGTEKTLKIKAIVIYDNHGKPQKMLGVDLDVTEVISAEEKIKTFMQQLEDVNNELKEKNAEITTFTYAAGHDLKTPLRKINTFSTWVLESEADKLSEKGKDYLNRITSSVRKMEMLIHDLLVLSRMYSTEPENETVDLNKVLNDVHQEMLDTIQEKKAVLETSTLPVLKGSPSQLFYLFKNLVGNALKFQFDGNVPIIHITSEIVNNPGNLGSQHTSFIKISFSDNGLGFDEKYTDKIFHMFQRLHGNQEFEGTGMGLAVCKKIMENHYGHIKAESSLGKGSCFSCYFPVIEDSN